MSASKWILCVCLLTFVPISATSEGSLEKNVKPGDDVFLQCQGTRDTDILLLKWIRPDRNSEGFDFYFRNHRMYVNYWHPSFYGRVELRDPQMKDGDVSVILKNVTVNDTGTYECYVSYGGKPQLITTTTLTIINSGGAAGSISDEGDNGARVEVAVAVSVAVMQVAVIALVILRTVIKQNLHQTSAQQAVVLQQV